MAGTRATARPAARAGRVGVPLAKPFVEVFRGLCRILRAAFGRLGGCQVGASSRALLVLVLFGFHYVPSLRAEWGATDTEKLVEIIRQLDGIKQSVDDIPNPNNLLTEISQSVSGQDNKIGIGRLIKTQEDFHHVFLTRFGFGLSGETLQDRLISLGDLLTSIKAHNENIHNALGYRGYSNLKEDLGFVLDRLDVIRKVLESDLGGVSDQDLNDILGKKLINDMPYPQEIMFPVWGVNATGDFVKRNETSRALGQILTAQIEQQYNVARFLNYWNGKNFDKVTTRLDDIISKMGAGSGGSADLTTVEEYLKAQNDYLMGVGSSSDKIKEFSGSKEVNGVTFYDASRTQYYDVTPSLLGYLGVMRRHMFDGFKYNLKNQTALAELLVSMDYQPTLEEMRDLLTEIADNTKNGSSSGGGNFAEELENALNKYLGTPSTAISALDVGNTSSVGGVDFSSLASKSVTPSSLIEVLASIAGDNALAASVNAQNQQALASLLWKAIMGNSGTGSSGAATFEFLSDVFKPGIPYFKNGKPFRGYFDTDEYNPASLIEALMVMNNNITRGTYVASENALAQGDLTYWATTNLIARMSPEPYWGEKRDDGRDSDYIYRFGEGADASTDGKPFNPTNYSPTISQTYTNFTHSIMINTNKVDIVDGDKILEKYYVESAFQQSGSSSTIQFEGTDSDWGTIKVTLPSIGGARSGGIELSLELKKGWEEIKPEAVRMLNKWLRPVCVAVWWFFGGLSCFVIVKKVGGI